MLESNPQAWEPRMVWPGQLVGSRVACERYRINKSTLCRRIKAGLIVPLAQLEGAYVFDISDLPKAEAA